MPESDVIKWGEMTDPVKIDEAISALTFLNFQNHATNIDTVIRKINHLKEIGMYSDEKAINTINRAYSLLPNNRKKSKKR